MTADIIIRGLAHRAGSDAEIDAFIGGAVLAADTLLLYPQLHQHTIIGEADVSVKDNGNVVVEACVTHPEWLIGFPFLALAIEDPEDDPRRIVQVSVTDSVINPLQSPYRIVDYPPEYEYELMHYYESVVEIDEAHLAAMNLNSDGSIQPIFDQSKAHIELRHRSERHRAALPDAVARGLGFESWQATRSSVSNGSAYVDTVLAEVLGVLSR